MASPARIHLCFPCFNPEASDWVRLGEYVARARKEINAELLVTVVDDGSARWVDPPAALIGTSGHELKLVRLPKNQGKGAAIKAAIAALPPAAPGTAEVFAFTDFDTPYTVENLSSVCAAIVTGSADLCIGDRSIRASRRPPKMRLSRLFSHHVFRLLVRTLIAGGVFDTQCGLKAYRADLVRLFPEVSRVDGFLFDLEWIYIALRHRLVLRCWPVDLEGHHESSRLRVFGNTRMLRDFWTILATIAGRRYDSPRIAQWGELERERTQRALSRATPGKGADADIRLS